MSYLLQRCMFLHGTRGTRRLLGRPHLQRTFQVRMQLNKLKYGLKLDKLKYGTWVARVSV